jgi:SAM-dependent methyltransferase
MEGTAILLETARCPRCACEPVKVVRRARSWLDDVEGDFQVRSCPRCGLWMLSPRPTASELARVYPPGYHRYGAVSRIRPSGDSRGRLLDVGCGTGAFLAVAANAGWVGTGVEISEEAAAIARSRGLEVIVGDALQVEYPPKRFDRVRCSHVLEHVTDPLLLLRRLRETVTDAGWITVIVPNRRSFASTAFRRFWYQLDLPRHLFHFAPSDIEALAALSGLYVRSARHMAAPTGLLGSIDCLMSAAPRMPTTELRSVPWLRSATRLVTWPIARLGWADAVEYELGPAVREPRRSDSSAIAHRPGCVERPRRKASKR